MSNFAYFVVQSLKTDLRYLVEVKTGKGTAIRIIKRLPDDKIYYVVNILENIEELAGKDSVDEVAKSQKAYQELQRFRKCSSMERNYKEELYAALEEKYESVD